MLLIALLWSLPGYAGTHDDVRSAIEDLFPEYSSVEVPIPRPGGPTLRFVIGLPSQEIIRRVRQAYAKRTRLSANIVVSGYSTSTQGNFSFTVKYFRGDLLGSFQLTTTPQGTALEFYPAPARVQHLRFRFWTPSPKKYLFPLK